MTLDQMIEVLQAAKAGKQIECCSRPDEPNYDLGWRPSSPCWDFYRCDYRVKPEPREWIVRTYNSGTSISSDSYALMPPDIKVREVL